MKYGNAIKIARILRSVGINGAKNSAILACAMAYAAPIPVDVRGTITDDCNKYYHNCVRTKVVEMVSEVNEVQVLDTAMIIDRIKETYLERVNAIVTPVIAPFAIVQNLDSNDLEAITLIVEVLRPEFAGV